MPSRSFQNSKTLGRFFERLYTPLLLQRTTYLLYDPSPHSRRLVQLRLELPTLVAPPPDSPRTVARRYNTGLFSQFITPGDRDPMPQDQWRRMLANLTDSRQELRDSLADMFNLPRIPPPNPPSNPDQPDSRPVKGLPSRCSQQPSASPSPTTTWRHKWGEYFNSAPGSVLGTRPHSPKDPEPHRGFTKAHNVGDTKDPSHDYYLRS